MVPFGPLFTQTHAARRVSLRIDVDEQNPLLCRSNGGGKIDRRCRLSHPSFLIGNADHSCHTRTLTEERFALSLK